MANKTLTTRIVLTHDLEENWVESAFIPSRGELVIYDPDLTYSYSRFKIGDGQTVVSELPFVIDRSVIDLLLEEDEDGYITLDGGRLVSPL